MQRIIVSLIVGIISLTAYSQDLRVSENQRFLVTAQGDPFFWLGDTGWEMLHRLDRTEMEHYMRNRAAKGFTVIQTVIVGEIDGLAFPNMEGYIPFEEFDPFRPNEGYFELVQIPLMRGRYFDERDDISAAPVAVVDQRLAQRHWPNANPVGKHIQLNKSPDPNTPWIEIVGVVGNVRSNVVGENPRVQVYRPFLQQPNRKNSILIRTRSDPKAYMAAVKDAVYQIDRRLLVCNARTMERVVWYWAANHRFITSLLSTFAGIALFLSAAGIYAITRYSVSRRTQEFGIRMALGADRNSILRLVLRKSLIPVIVGAGIGLVGTVAAAKVMSSLLYQTSPWDPLTYVVVCVLLAGVAMLASYFPARRAAKINPMEALRYE